MWWFCFHVNQTWYRVITCFTSNSGVSYTSTHANIQIEPSCASCVLTLKRYWRYIKPLHNCSFNLWTIVNLNDDFDICKNHIELNWSNRTETLIDRRNPNLLIPIAISYLATQWTNKKIWMRKKYTQTLICTEHLLCICLGLLGAISFDCCDK